MQIDIYYIILVLPTVVLSMVAQFMVKSTFSKYSNIRCSKNITGSDAANIILRNNSVNDVAIEAVAGSLTDHYDPSSKKVRLSEPVHSQPTLAAIGVAAHEAGHAIQHATKYGPLVLRSKLVPVANIGSQAGPLLAMAGLVLSFPLLLNLGILLFTGAVLFYVVTLPVEFNASSRALALLKRDNLLSPQELAGAKKVLTAAALTYVASALTALMNLIVLIIRARSRR